ncbi:hypothetical protein, partial [Streptosporangium sp. KLBMP 9127]|nr:hypothetical protein [Streptosporangium sp. KLBMP 9127]
AIALFSFDLVLSHSKDHAMAVLINDATPVTRPNSYTTSVDATRRVAAAQAGRRECVPWAA